MNVLSIIAITIAATFAAATAVTLRTIAQALVRMSTDLSDIADTLADIEDTVRNLTDRRQPKNAHPSNGMKVVR